MAVWNMNALEHVFPLLGGKPTPGNATSTTVESDVYGTAFAIGGGLFLTAGHSLRGASEHEVVGLGVASGPTWQIVPVIAHDIIESADLGILRADIPSAKCLAWEPREQSMLDTVQCCGYPYALDRTRMVIDIRAFRGHVVGVRPFPLLSASPRIYELSFACPRGLSGAPLFTATPQSYIVGMIIGNTSTDMLVLSSREVLTGGGESIIEHYERMQLGIAQGAQSMLSIASTVLGGSIEAHLRANGLLRA